MPAPLPNRLKPQAIDGVVVLVTLLAPALGGSTELWAQAVLLLGLATVLVVDPPRRWPPLWLLVPVGLLAVWPMLAYLPVDWFGAQPYRAELLAETGLELGDRLGVQPWVTLEVVMVWWAGLAWTLVLACRSWTLSRVWLLRLWVGGMLGFALVTLTVYAVDGLPAWWRPGHGFGSFPNRNHTGNVLALAALVSLALGGRDLLRARLSAWFWFGTYLLLGIAIVVNGSRAGVLLYLGGAFVWTVWTAASRRSAQRLGWGLASVLGLLTLFILFGGPTLDRFLRPGEPVPSLAAEFLQRTDPGAYRLATEASWHGIGLGNFAAVFPHYAELVAPEKRAIHPESDWVWLQIELGWVAPVLIFGLALVWMIRHRPRVDQADFLLRTALAVAGALFLLHGFAEVAGHRPGALWPALFLMALLREPLTHELGSEPHAIPWLPRLVALPAGAVSVIWLLPPAAHPIPSSAQAALLRDQLEFSMQAGAYPAVVTDADRLLQWSQLASEAHFYRGLAGAYGGAPLAEPVRDFLRARALDRRDPRLALFEGNAWLFREPTRSFPAWAEALRRAGPNRARYYRDILVVGSQLPSIRHELFSLALGDPELLLVFLQHGPPEEFQEEIDRWLIDDPGLLRFQPGQRRLLLTLWSRKGDLDLLAQWLDAHPSYLPEAWPARAGAVAKLGDARAACELAARFVPSPTLPTHAPARSEAAMRRRLTLDPGDPMAAYTLFQVLCQAAQPADALGVLRRAIDTGRAPPYFHFLKARLLSEQGHWEAAWKAWQQYLSRSPLPADVDR
jgi:tetratricopeptide (TPR) repeat protein